MENGDCKFKNKFKMELIAIGHFFISKKDINQFRIFPKSDIDLHLDLTQVNATHVKKSTIFCLRQFFEIINHLSL
jgi:hypothetical protein